MSTNAWPYHYCLRCGTPIETAGRIWCDSCDERADAELGSLLGGGPDE